MHARVIDDTLIHENRYAGSSQTITDLEVLVTGARSPESARSEAEYHATRMADGWLERLVWHSTEGPLTDGAYIVRLTTTVSREW